MYLNHLKINYNVFALNFDTLCSLNFLILVFEVTRSDEDAIEHGKIMRQDYYLFDTPYVFNIFSN